MGTADRENRPGTADHAGRPRVRASESRRRHELEHKRPSLRGTQGLQASAAKIRAGDSGQKMNSSQTAETSRSQFHLIGCGEPEQVWSDPEPQNVVWCVTVRQDSALPWPNKSRTRPSHTYAETVKL